MNIKILVMGVIILVASIFSIASASIGIEAYNQEFMAAFKAEKSSNFKYLVGSLVLGILSLIASVGILVVGVKVPNIPFF